MATADQERYPLWSRGDLDGFFGLMVDNLVQVLLIVALCTFVVQLPAEFVYQRILPGVAVSLLIGNLFYGLQARRVARRQGNPTCTALPYGINTPSVVAYAYFVMAPQYQLAVLGGATPERAAELAWLAGIAACLVSGLVEFAGAFCAERLRRVTPRAALLGVLAAVGITFIASDFAFRLYTRPLVGVLPLGILLLAYFARYRFLWGLPGGFLAVLVGTVIAWGMSVTGTAAFGGAPDLSVTAVAAAAGEVRLSWPVFQGEALVTLLTSPDLIARFLAVSIPMGLMNVIGSLQNIESAEAGGDRFATGPSLAVNGLGSLAAGMFGSCFPTTIYIGHPGWKALGARAGYSILNGVFFTVAFVLGLGPLLAAVIPIEAGAAIVMYIGIIITAQAFQATPDEHAPAVSIALFPALAAFLVVTLNTYFDANGGQTLADVLLHPAPTTQYLPGLLTLTGANSAWIIVTLVLTAIGAALIDRKYKIAAMWCGAATVMTVLGFMHAYRIEGNTIREYFVWQQVAAVQAAAPATSAPRALAGATSTMTGTSGPTTAVAARPDAPAAKARMAAAPATVTYRAIPIAVGYALATILLAAAAWRGDREEGRAAPPAAEALPAHDDIPP
jgi:AGZA family xanthine/uracil permease-like MFS transporter